MMSVQTLADREKMNQGVWVHFLSTLIWIIVRNSRLPSADGHDRWMAEIASDEGRPAWLADWEKEGRADLISCNNGPASCQMQSRLPTLTTFPHSVAQFSHFRTCANRSFPSKLRSITVRILQDSTTPRPSLLIPIRVSWWTFLFCCCFFA